MALPWLEIMAKAAPAGAERLAEPPLRSMFLFMPNGVVPELWTPPGDGEAYEITPHLKPLASLQNDFLLLENLWKMRRSNIFLTLKYTLKSFCFPPFQSFL